MLIRIRDEERGIAMIVSLLVVFVVLLLATVVFGQAIHNSNSSAYDRNRLTSVGAAEAGLNYFYNNLQTWSPSLQPVPGVATLPVGSGPGTASFTATPTFYSDTPSDPTFPTLFSGTITSSNYPRSVKIKSVGTTSGGTARTMESFVVLRPVYGGFNGALIANSSTTFSNNFTVNGLNGNDADIYILTGDFSAPSGLESIHGSIFVPTGSATIGTNLHIYGQVWANTAVSATHPQAQIDGDVKSTIAGVTISSGTVGGNAYYCTGAAPSNVAGTKNQTCALGPPPTQSFPQITYNQTDWQNAGYTNIQTFSGASACTTARAYVESTGAYAATGFSGHSVGNTIVRIAATCTYGNSNNADIIMNGNLAIITDGGVNLSQHSDWDGATSLRDLFFISTWPPNCPTEDITVGNLTSFNSLTETFVYTPCTATMNNNNAAFTGQVIGTNLVVGNQFSENYKPVLVPGYTNVTSYNQDIAYIREVA